MLNIQVSISIYISPEVGCCISLATITEDPITLYVSSTYLGGILMTEVEPLSSDPSPCRAHAISTKPWWQAWGLVIGLHLLQHHFTWQSGLHISLCSSSRSAPTMGCWQGPLGQAQWLQLWLWLQSHQTGSANLGKLTSIAAPSHRQPCALWLGKSIILSAKSLILGW